MIDYIYLSPYGEIKFNYNPLSGIQLKKDGSADYRTKTGKCFRIWEQNLIKTSKIAYEAELTTKEIK